MQVLITGFFVSLILWSVIAYASLQVSLKLHRDAGLPEKWLLVLPYVFASLIFYAIRYRFSLWFLDKQALHELFSIGSFEKADLFAFIICLPLFYVISVLRPHWILRVSVNVPLLLFLPAVIKLILYFSGLASWDAIPAKLVPTRLE